MRILEILSRHSQLDGYQLTTNHWAPKADSGTNRNAMLSLFTLFVGFVNVQQIMVLKVVQANSRSAGFKLIITFHLSFHVRITGSGLRGVCGHIYIY